jgi:hypothetical protein
MMSAAAPRISGRPILRPIALALLLISGTAAQQVAANRPPGPATGPAPEAVATIQYRGSFAPDSSGDLCAGVGTSIKCVPYTRTSGLTGPMSLPKGTYNFWFADDYARPQSHIYNAIDVPAGPFELDSALAAHQQAIVTFDGSKAGIASGQLCLEQSGATNCVSFTAAQPAHVTVVAGPAVGWVLDATSKVAVPKRPVTLSSGDNSFDGVLISSGDSGGSATPANGGDGVKGAPSVTELDPPSITAGSPAQSLSIEGSNLSAVVKVSLDDHTLTADHISDKELRVYLSSDDLKMARPAVLTVSDKAGESDSKTLVVKPWSSRFTRIYLGLEDTGASSTDAQAELLVGADTEAQLGSHSPLYFWLSPRLTSLAQKDPGSAAGLFEGSYLASAFDGSVSKLVRAFEFEAGPEILLGDPADKPTSDYDNDHSTRTIVGLIADFGAITPLSPSELDQSLAVFEYPNQSGKNCDGTALSSGKQPPDICPTVFVPDSRNRFMYRYAAGVRFNTYYYNPDGTLQQRFPGTIDWTFGQDQSVSHGSFAGLTMRVEANYPIPALSGVNIFGTVAMKPFDRPRTYNTLILSPDPGMTASSPDVQTIHVAQPDRDYFSLGVAFDLSTLLTKGHS